jgi:hypothetical protein
MNKRIYKIHIKSLIKASGNLEHAKLYCYYLNLHCLYAHKVIHNFKSRFQFITQKTGYSDYEIRKFTNGLIKEGLARFENNHLYLSNKYKVIDMVGVTYNDLVENGQVVKKADILKAKSKFIEYHSPEPISLNEFRTIALKITLDLKRREIFNKEKNIITGKLNCKKQGIILPELEKEVLIKLAKENDACINIHLYLPQIQSLFGLNSIQAASQLLKRLCADELIERKQRFHFYNKKAAAPKAMLEGRYQKMINGYPVEQLASQIVFSDTFLKRYVNRSKSCAFMNKIEKKFDEHKSNCFQLKKVNKQKFKLEQFVSNEVNNIKVELDGQIKRVRNPLKFSVNIYKETLYCRQTGEVILQKSFKQTRNLLKNIKAVENIRFKVFNADVVSNDLSVKKCLWTKEGWQEINELDAKGWVCTKSVQRLLRFGS